MTPVSPSIFAILVGIPVPTVYGRILPAQGNISNPKFCLSLLARARQFHPVYMRGASYFLGARPSASSPAHGDRQGSLSWVADLPGHTIRSWHPDKLKNSVTTKVSGSPIRTKDNKIHVNIIRKVSKNKKTPTQCYMKKTQLNVIRHRWTNGIEKCVWQ